MASDSKPWMEAHTFQGHAFKSGLDLDRARRRLTRMIEHWPDRIDDLLPVLQKMIALAEKLNEWKEEG